jgi:hypothetical protein
VPRVGVAAQRSFPLLRLAGSAQVDALDGLKEYEKRGGMSQDMEAVYQARLRRYVTVLNNKKPDRVPIRRLVAEFTRRHAGYTCQ